MQKDPRFLPRHITRFNYWPFFAPKPQHQLAPAAQWLGEYPEVAWSDRPGHTAAHRHIQHTFRLRLKQSADSAARQFYALKDYVWDDKEWENDPEAQRVKKQLTPRRQNAIDLLNRKLWRYRSQWTWDKLLETIADDQESFLKYCERAPDERAVSEAMKQRIYQHYSKQAIKLLGGGGTYIPPARRSKYQVPNPLDESDNPKLTTLLNARGRIDIPSIFEVDWLDCKSNDERREAKKRTLHWFHHALRNLLAYRNRRAPIPWTTDCAKRCRRLQQKLCT